MISTEEILLSEFIATLLRGGKLTSAQDKQLKELLQEYPQARVLFEQLLEEGQIKSKLNWKNFDPDEQWAEFTRQHQKVKTSRKTRKLLFWLVSTAASVLLILGTYVIWSVYLNKSQLEYIVEDKIYGQRNDVTPGGNMAILQLGDGRQLLLDSSKQKIDLNGLEISENELIYPPSLSLENSVKHRLLIPSRAVYQTQLSDGTRVWLNSESELEYYPHFEENERRVHLKGEAYFVVAKDEKRPFIVDNKELELQALGTEFNVNAYGTHVRVSLIEGKLSVSSTDEECIISAGKEVRMRDRHLQVTNIRDVEAIMAWRKNIFHFGNKNLKQLLSEIARWYGVKVHVENGVDLQRQYEGGIRKDVSLGRICEVLSYLTAYNYIIDQNNLFVRSKTRKEIPR